MSAGSGCPACCVLQREHSCGRLQCRSQPPFNLLSDYLIMSLPTSLGCVHLMLLLLFAPACRLDIALDLPPPAAVLRRQYQGAQQPAYDMGPLIPPVHNPNEANTKRQRDFMRPPGQPERPPTQVLEGRQTAVLRRMPVCFGSPAEQSWG
jgi:hypothetical protein